MTANALERVDELHEFAATREIGSLRVNSAAFTEFHAAARDLARTVKDVEDEAIVDMSYTVERLRFAAASTPLPFDDPLLTQVARDTISRATTWIRTARPSLVPIVDQIHRAVEMLVATNENPLLSELEAALAGSSLKRVALVLPGSKLVSAAAQVVASRSTLATRVTVLTPIALRSENTRFEAIYLLGPISWYPPYVVTAPRAPRIITVSYDCLPNRLVATPSFVGGTTSQGVDFGRTPDDTWPGLNWTVLEREARRRFGDADSHDSVSARLHKLHGGFAVYLDVADRSILSIETAIDGRRHPRRTPTTELRSGTLIVLRTEGGGDYIRPVADMLLGARASQLRARQTDWKSRLRKAVAATSLIETAVDLIDYGSPRADEQNVRNWMSPANICTQDQSDFAAIARLVGLAPQTEQLWRMMGEIRKAHLRAGALIRRRLLHQIAAMDSDEIEIAGRVDFTLPEAEGGRLTAFRIEAVAPTVALTPWARVGRPFELAS